MKALLPILVLACLHTTTVCQAELSDGLVGHWTFNGNAGDSSGNGHHGMVNGATLTSDRFGESNSAYSFDGINDYIEIPDSSDFNTQDFTVAMWFKPERLPNVAVNTEEAGFLISKGSINYELHIGSAATGATGMRFLPRYGSGNHWDAPVGSYELNEWQQVVAVYKPSANEVRFYIDGIEKTLTGPASAIAGADTALSIWLGMRRDNTLAFKGCMDDVRIYNRALAPAEVQQLYKTESAPNGLLAHWTFSGNAKDSSGNKHHGVVNGATLAPDRFGIANSAYQFNGINQLINCPDTNFPSNNAPRTVSLWAKLDSFGTPVPNVSYLFSYGVDGPTNAFYLITDATNGPPFIAVGKSGGGDFPKFQQPATDTWYHFTITYEGSTTILYVNGTTAISGTRSYATTLSGQFSIGSYMGGSPPTHHGLIDDVRVYNRALSPAEVQELYEEETVKIAVDTPPGSDALVTWGSTSNGQTTLPNALTDVAKISAGGLHSLVLKTDGTVAAWGSNVYGQLNLPEGLTDVVSISAGYDFNLAVKSDHTVVAWGDNSHGQLNIPEGLTGVVAVAGGMYHSLALKEDGTVVGWSPEYAAPPAGLTDVTAISAGFFQSMALKSNGTVVAWGYNDFGQTDVPAGLTDVVAISAGGHHCLALKSDGTIVAWGDNRFGQINVPEGLTGVVAITAGGLHSLVLKRDGTVLVFGENVSNQLELPPDLDGVTSIAAGAHHSLVLKKAVVFGNQVTGTSSLAKTLTIKNLGTTPLEITGVNVSGDDFTVNTNDMSATVPASGSTTLTVTFNPNSVGAKSANLRVESNDPDEESLTIPLFGTSLSPPELVVQHDGADVETSLIFWGKFNSIPKALSDKLTDVVTIARGSLHLLALMNDGTVFAWGDNHEGQTNVPAGMTNVVAVAPGGFHNLVLKSNGTVAAWGDSYLGQAFVPNDLTDVVAIAAGYEHSAALKSDGTVVVWGKQNSTPDGLTDVIAIAVGAVSSHNLALKSDGTVAVWGDNSHGEMDVPAGLDNVVAIAADGSHNLALKSDGTVVAWGDNSKGQTDVPSGLTGVVAISAGSSHSLALKSDGTVIAWGDNTQSQTTLPDGLSGIVAIKAGGAFNMAVRRNLALGDSEISTPKASTFTIKNAGGSPLAISSVSILENSSSEFTVDSTGMSNSVSGPTGETTFTVSFNPTTMGTKRAILRLLSDDPDEGVFDILLTGNGIDTHSPTISVPEETRRVFAGTLADYTGLAQVTDNTQTTVTQSPAVGSAITHGIVTVTLTATDEGGNQSTTTFDLDVRPLSAVNTTYLAQGDTAPGAGTTGGPPSDAKLVSFAPPAIDDEGNVAFFANWRSATQGKGGGLFMNDSCLAIIGGDAPELTGLKFKSFTDPVVNGGNVAFIATMSGASAAGDKAVFAGTPLTFIAREGELPPGHDGLIPAGGAKFKAFKSVAISGDSVAFLAQLTGGAGVEKATGGTDMGLWIKDGTSPLKLAMREGQQLDGKTIKTLVSFAPGNDSPGQGRGWLSKPAGSAVLALATFTDKSQAVISAGVGGDDITILSQTGVTGNSSSPDVTNATFASYGFPAVNDQDTCAFLASMTLGEGGVTKTNARGIFLSTGSAYKALARIGEDAGATDAVFSVLKDPVLSSDDGVAFSAILKGSTTKGFATETIWWKTADGDLTLLAQGGARPGPDLPTDAQWKAFSSLAIAGGRGPIFAATLVPNKGGVTAAKASGVWGCDFTGAPRLLFRTGDIIGGKTLKAFIVLKATVGSPGVTRSFNDNAQVVWLATFTDKSQAIITTEIP